MFVGDKETLKDFILNYHFLCNGRTFNDIAQILEMSKTRVQQLFDGLLNKIIKQGA